MKTVVQREMIAEGTLVLVNADYPMKRREEKKAAVREDSPEISMCEIAALRLRELLERIGAGDEIVPVSGWRTREEQEEIYAQSLLENGETFTKSYVALPGHSEHQTGLAIDLGVKKERVDFIRPEFPHTGICGKFRGMAADYGFIERYGKDKETITGIAHEPWHFRYVGRPHASIMEERGLCLEEYLLFLKAYTRERPLLFSGSDGSRAQIYYVPAECEETVLTLPDDSDYWISGNNMDGFIVTLEKGRRKRETKRRVEKDEDKRVYGN